MDVSEAHTTTLFWITQPLPVDPVYFILVARLPPPVFCHDRVHIAVKRFRQLE